MERRRISSETIPTTSTLTRPESSLTEDSRFVDSAIDMDEITSSSPKNGMIDNGGDRQASSLSPISQSISDRMRRLAAVAWTLEQDEDLSEARKQRVEDELTHLEAIFEEAEAVRAETTYSQSISKSSSHHNMADQTRAATVKSQSDESDILHIRNSLDEVVAGMRLRQQEQRHLHQLTATKLEAVAQRCLFQEQQMQDLMEEMKSLRTENQKIGQENDRLAEVIAEMEVESTRKEVAVSAMTSAVDGLAGWIDDADRSQLEHDYVAASGRRGRQRRAVIRGRGRFRGRYYVDEDDNGDFWGSPDARELQDGVKAWIRGFRDVEDACSSPDRGQLKDFHTRPTNGEDDDWGEFESPA